MKNLLEAMLKLKETKITSDGEYSLQGDANGYHIYKGNERKESLGLINKEDALVRFDEYLKDLNESKDNWHDDSDRINKILNDKYDEYVKNNPDNHLSYFEWSMMLPRSYKDEILKDNKL